MSWLHLARYYDYVCEIGNLKIVGKLWNRVKRIFKHNVSFLRIWSHLLKKSLMENFIFLCSVICISNQTVRNFIHIWNTNYKIPLHLVCVHSHCSWYLLKQGSVWSRVKCSWEHHHSQKHLRYRTKLYRT